MKRAKLEETDEPRGVHQLTHESMGSVDALRGTGKGWAPLLRTQARMAQADRQGSNVEHRRFDSCRTYQLIEQISHQPCGRLKHDIGEYVMKNLLIVVILVLLVSCASAPPMDCTDIANEIKRIHSRHGEPLRGYSEFINADPGTIRKLRSFERAHHLKGCDD